MGQFLMIALKLELGVKKDYIRKHVKEDRSEEYILNQMEKKLNLENYNRKEYDEYYGYELSKEILDSELMTFLKRFYDFRYAGGYNYKSDVVISKLEPLSTDERLELLEERSYQCYQEDRKYDVFYLDNDSWSEIPYISKEMILSMDGKIIMECYGEILDFFKRCIISNFKDLKISSAIDVYISD